MRGPNAAAPERPPVVKRVATKFHWLIESLCREDTKRPTLVVSGHLTPIPHLSPSACVHGIRVVFVKTELFHRPKESVVGGVFDFPGMCSPLFYFFFFYLVDSESCLSSNFCILVSINSRCQLEREFLCRWTDREGVIEVAVRLEYETVWLLLLRNSVVRDFRTTQKGK